MYFLTRIRLSTDSSTASASSWHTVQFSMHADARGTNKTHEQKKSGTTLTTRKASFAAWNPQFVSHEKKKTVKEGDRETRTGFGRDARFFLGNYGNGTEVCFKGTVTTYTFAIKGKK